MDAALAEFDQQARRALSIAWLFMPDWLKAEQPEL